MRSAIGDDTYGALALNAVETCFEGIPVQISNSTWRDVPVYQVARLTAALVHCMLLADPCLVDYTSPPAEIMNKDYFQLVSLDLSGIQKFIYTLTTKRALKGLRARSLYLSLLMEYTVDCLLMSCGVTRANLVYSGGGRAHLILPNTEKAKHAVEEIVQQTNAFLSDTYDAALYMASGAVSYNGKDLLYNQADCAGLSALFFETSRKISARKLKRYRYDELVKLNNKHIDQQRECSICGMCHNLHTR